MDNALMIVQLRKSKNKRLKEEKSDLRNNFSETRKTLEEHQNQFSELHSSSSASDLEASYLTQQLAKAQSEQERNSSL
jgi:hypothetical protein